MLNEIKTALEALGKPVFYGQASTLDGGDVWDYIVFSRSHLSSSQNKTGLSDTYSVWIVQEEYIDDGAAEAVIAAMTAIPGVRLVNGNIPYQYTTKPNTQTLLEVLELDFVKPRKACDNG